ncbi:MAG: head GIN domain-containing protein, partial [Chitinophagaceae bacterium]
MKRLILYSFLFSITLSSCHFGNGKRIRGNGNIKSETRNAGQFSKIDVGGNIDVYVKQDSVSAVRIEADENLLEYIHITVDDGTLDIRNEEGYNLSSVKGIKVYVSGPSFRYLEASGACNILSENQIDNYEKIGIHLTGASNAVLEINSPKIEVELTGASYITLKGKCKTLSLDGSGASGFKCFELMAEEVSIELSGASNAEVFASMKLDADISGAADIKYKGNATVSQH